MTQHCARTTFRNIHDNLKVVVQVVYDGKQVLSINLHCLKHFRGYMYYQHSVIAEHCFFCVEWVGITYVRGFDLKSWFLRTQYWSACFEIMILLHSGIVFSVSRIYCSSNVRATEIATQSCNVFFYICLIVRIARDNIAHVYLIIASHLINHTRIIRIQNRMLF